MSDARGNAPKPVPDMNWDAERAEAFTNRMTALWTGLLATLPERRVVPGASGSAARVALALDVPEDPMPDDALFEHLGALTFDWAAYCGHPRFMAYITAVRLRSCYARSAEFPGISIWSCSTGKGVISSEF